MDVAQLITDLIAKVDSIQGKQDLVIWMLGSAGAFIGGGIIYLARCVFSLGEEVNHLAGTMKKPHHRE